MADAYYTEDRRELKDWERKRADEFLNEARTQYGATVKTVPEAYRHLIMGLPMNTAIMGRKENKNRLYVKTQQAYLPVRSRNRWFIDVHRTAKAHFKIIPTFHPDLLGNKQMVCRCVITSSLHGEAVAHSASDLSQFGNDLENLETGAVGRALGLMGYCETKAFREVRSQEPEQNGNGAEMPEGPQPSTGSEDRAGFEPTEQDHANYAGLFERMDKCDDVTQANELLNEWQTLRETNTIEHWATEWLESLDNLANKLADMLAAANS